MSIIPILAVAGSTFIGGSRVYLLPQEAVAIGIDIGVVNLETEFDYPYPLFAFEVRINGFSTCNRKGVSIELLSDTGELIFTSELASEQGKYLFQITESNLEWAEFLIHCDTGPDALDYSYAIRLAEHVQAP